MAELSSQPIAATPLRPVTPAGIVAARLERALNHAELLGRVTGEHGVADDLVAELRQLKLLAAGLEPYVERCSTPASAQLVELDERTIGHDWARLAADSPAPYLEAEMLSGHVEGQLLKFLVAMTRARGVLDIGMFTGYSALAVAEALEDGGRVVACEIDPAVAAFAQRGFDASPDGAKIDVRVGPADATLAALASGNEQFDLVFVDADKGGYERYVSTVLDAGLLADNGTICVDNTLMQGEPWSAAVPSVNGAAIAAFNDAIARDGRVEQVLIPLRDGITLIRRRA